MQTKFGKQNTWSNRKHANDIGFQLHNLRKRMKFSFLPKKQEII